jgi:two-component system nitrate/nitrite response regulator NarL
MAACFANGARGYIVKNVSALSLLAFVNLAAMGHKIMPPELAEQLQRDPSSYGDQTSGHVSIEEAGISRREEEVLGYLVEGQPNKSIARSLDVSEATVNVHVKAILRNCSCPTGQRRHFGPTLTFRGCPQDACPRSFEGASASWE